MAKCHSATVLSIGSSPESSFQMKTEMHTQYSYTWKNMTCQTKILQHTNTLLSKLLHLETRAITKLSNISTVNQAIVQN